MNHAQSAAQFLKDQKKAKWHDQALWFLREKRDKASKSIPEWEQLRDTADLIKAHTISHLDQYLEQFEKNALSNGIQVHWAKDDKEHNQIVLSILEKHQAKKVVKSKSMLTEECGLNHFLEEKNIEVVDTDLGERIIQLRHEAPSHIVVPAIHLQKEQVSETFHQMIHSEKGNADPTYLTRFARAHLREKFINADVGITGVNFMIASEGAFVVCTNEGNADLGTSLPKVHIACAGIEKLIPDLASLAVFTRILARSATGQPITTYTSHFKKPMAEKEIHLVLVDNGRSKILAEEHYRKSLQCIRCGACLNTCPVYRGSGGHSYHQVIPGPIGSVLAPHKEELKAEDLPFASSLCGSCTNVCPVKVDLHHQLLAWRQTILSNRPGFWVKRTMMSMGAFVFKHPKLYRLQSKAIKLLRFLPDSLINSKINPWCHQRKTPTIPNQTFKELYQKRKRK